MKRFLALLSIAVSLAACGEQQPVDISHLGIPIINGQTDSNPAHNAVVAMTFGQYMCTGTLISPDVVLTAAHCVSGFSASAFTVYFGSSVYSSTRRYVSDTLVHSHWDAQNLINDIAMLRLSSQAPSYVTPIPYLPHSLGISQLDVGGILEYVGFGEDEYGNAGSKLTVENALNWVCTNGGGCSIGNGGWAVPNSICSDQSPGGPCEGDSGGPAFVTRSGQEYVAGITSYGDQNCAYFGCSTKVDEFESFIIDFVGGELGASCVSSAQCDSGHCIDGVCCESTCPGECEACNVGGNWGHCVQVPSGTLCPDANLCNGTETCQNGSCVAGQPLDCSNSNLCTDEACDPASGCLYNPVTDGTACLNSNVCDGEESCFAGMCRSGTTLDCDDHNPCSDDFCDTHLGCSHASVDDGIACGGGLCGAAACSGGHCLATDSGACDDQDPCTDDWCNPDSGCEHETRPDGYACGECMMCLEQQCVEAPDCGGSGCGCSHSSNPAAGAGGLALLVLAMLLWRRP